MFAVKSIVAGYALSCVSDEGGDEKSRSKSKIFGTYDETPTGCSYVMSISVISTLVGFDVACGFGLSPISNRSITVGASDSYVFSSSISA